MSAREIRPDVYSVAALDWDRRLFDELIPLPDGTSYNSYLVNGSDKTALIDGVDPTKEDELLKNLGELGVKSIDYVIANHAEQDHSGAIPRLLELFPEAKVVASQACVRMLSDLLFIPEEKMVAVKDGETLSLGGKTLKFIYAAWVHWPETMLTYLKEDKILFPCDLFGSHLASSDLYAVDEARVMEAAKRYFAEIMMPFRKLIVKHLEKVRSMEVELIAPSHGPIYDNPGFILKAYGEWVSGEVKNEVVIPYVSMHGSTREMIDYLAEALIKRGITVKPFNLTSADTGELAKALVDAATVIVGSPTVLGGAHPSAVYAAFLANALKPKAKFASTVTSCGWHDMASEQITGLLSGLKVELISPVAVRGRARKKDYESLDALADEVLKKHGELGILGNAK